MKLSKPTIKKAHRIARKVAKRGGARNPYAVGTAVAKKLYRKNKRARR